MSRSNVNQVILTGRLTKNPEVRTTPSGIYVCDFTIAVNRYGNNNVQYTEYPRCTCWNKTAEFAGDPEKGLKTGDLVLVRGRLADDNFETTKGDPSTMTRGRLKVDQCSVDVLARSQPKTDEPIPEQE